MKPLRLMPPRGPRTPFPLPYSVTARRWPRSDPGVCSQDSPELSRLCQKYTFTHEKQANLLIPLREGEEKSVPGESQQLKALCPILVPATL